MIKCANKSPRICGDSSIRWYEGDTFELNFEMTFTDDEGNEIPTDSDTTITICFRKNNVLVHEVSVVGNNLVNVVIDKEITKKFKRGVYTYCVRRNGNYITTVIHHNKVVVE